MNTINLEGMSTDDLWSLHEKITQILSARVLSEKRELEKRLAVLKRSQAVVDGDRNGEVKVRRQYPRVFPKYRNPALPNETWSGRGKQPRWLVAALKSGHKIHEFEIQSQSKTKSGLRRA